jgi:hypothetical protein
MRSRIQHTGKAVAGGLNAVYAAVGVTEVTARSIGCDVLAYVVGILQGRGGTWQ